MSLVFAAAPCETPHFGYGPESAVEAPVAVMPPSLQLRLEAPRTVRAGQSVRLRLVLENREPFPVEVALEGRPVAFDFVVVAPDGAEVWRRSERVPGRLLLQLRTLGFREAIDFSDCWDQRDSVGLPVEPGTYRVRGVLPVDGAPDGWETDAHVLTVLP
jgi:hypothetical protein